MTERERNEDHEHIHEMWGAAATLIERVKDLWEAGESIVETHSDLHMVARMLSETLMKGYVELKRCDLAIASHATLFAAYTKALGTSEPDADPKVLFWRVADELAKAKQKAIDNREKKEH